MTWARHAGILGTFREACDWWDGLSKAERHAVLNRWPLVARRSTEESGVAAGLVCLVNDLLDRLGEPGIRWAGVPTLPMVIQARERLAARPADPDDCAVCRTCESVFRVTHVECPTCGASVEVKT